MNVSPTGRAYAAAVVNATIVGFSFLLVKIALTEASPLDILAHRFTAGLAAVVILALAGVIKLRLTLRAVAAILPLALLYPGLFFAFQTFGLARASSSEAGIIQAAAPIFTMLMAAIWLKERAGLRQKLFMLLSVGGVVTVFAAKGFEPGQSSAAGLLLVLLSTMSLAGYSVLARKLAKDYRAAELTVIMTLIGFVLFNGMSLANHAAEGTMADYFAPLASLKFTESILYLGVLSSLVTSFLTNYALSQIKAFEVSVFNQFATLVSMAAGVFILAEQLSGYHVAGALLIVMGVVGVCLPTRARKQKPLSERKLGA